MQKFNKCLLTRWINIYLYFVSFTFALPFFHNNTFMHGVNVRYKEDNLCVHLDLTRFSSHTLTRSQRHYRWNSYDTAREHWAVVPLTKAWPPLMDSNNYGKWLPWFQPPHLGQRRPPTVSVVLCSSLYTYIKSWSNAFCDVVSLRESNEGGGVWERAGEVEGDHVVIEKLENVLKKEKANRVEWFRVCVLFSWDISMNGHLFYKKTELS